MNNEIQTLQQQQQELLIARQELEIIKLRNELQEIQVKKASRLEDSLFSPALYKHYMQVAETMAASEMVPNSYRKKPNDVFIAMAKGYQVGFSIEQSLEHISVINGRSCIWGDGLMALALSHPACESIKEEPIMNGNNVVGYICTVKRTGFEPHSKRFTVQDAENAGLFGRGAVWKSYPERMLQMRARSLAVRDRFADALMGMEIAEIMQEEAKREAIEGEVVKPAGTTQVEKLKSMLSEKQDDMTQVTNNETVLSVHNTGSDEEPATEEQVKEILGLMEAQGFDDARIERAYGYFKVESPRELTQAQAIAFLIKLGKK